MAIWKYHFLVLWRKLSIPRYTPILPKAVARKKMIPSGVRFWPLPRIDLRLSLAIMKKAKRLMAAKIPKSIWRAFILLKYHAGVVI